MPKLAVSVRDRVLWTSNAFYDASIRLKYILKYCDRLLYHLFVCLNKSSQTSSSGFKPSQAALERLKQRKIGQQSREAIVKKRFRKEQRESMSTEEVETGTRADIATYLLREDSLELQFLYVSEILSIHGTLHLSML